MNIIKKDPNKKYGIQHVGKGLVRIVKVLKDYPDDNVAADDLARLLIGEVTEQDLLGTANQDMEAAKVNNRVLVLEAKLRKIRHEIVQALGEPDTLERTAREIVKDLDE